MKYIKIQKKLLFVVNFFIVLVGALLFFLLPTFGTLCFYVFWISTLGALFFIATPIGNQRLTNHAEPNAPRLSWHSLFFRILLLELTLLGVYAGICFLSGKLFLINTSFHPDLFSNTLRLQLLNTGLFPWSLYAVISVGMGMLAYREQTQAYFSNLIKPFTQKDPHAAINFIFNISARRLTVFAVSMMILFLTLLLLSFAMVINIPIHNGFQQSALLTTLGLLFIAFSKKAKQYIHRIFSRHIPTALSFPVVALGLGLLILLLETITAGLTSANTMQQPPYFIARWMHYHWQTAWTVFSFLWWICLAPAVCGFIARLSKGHKIRDIIIAILALPVLIALLFIFPNTALISLLHFSPLAIKIIALISFLILLPLLINNAHLPTVIESYFPKAGIIKYRDHTYFFETAIQLTITCFYLYWVIGINGLSALLFAANYVGIFTMLAASCGIIKTCASLARDKNPSP